MVEALVGAALLALAVGSLAATAALAARSARRTRDAGIGLAMTAERLEALRAGPRGSGEDVQTGPGGVIFRRRWQVEDGRGDPTRIEGAVDWDGGSLELRTEVQP